MLFSYLSLPAIQERNREELLLHTVKEESYHKVHGKVTAKALMNYGDNPLLLAIRVRKYTIACLNCKAHKYPTKAEDFRLDIRGFPISKPLFQTFHKPYIFFPFNVQMNISKPVSSCGANMGYCC